jgi:uncharacterized protein (DUF58 family)
MSIDSIRATIRQIRERLNEESTRSMWKNFSTSMGLLGVALFAALYSSSSAREGRAVAAGVSAAIALGIAIWVGIRFVPRLAANVEWDWLRLSSRYQITRDGWIYLGAVIVVVFAAINTSNNLLYMVLSALLAVLLLSGFLSGVNFRRLRVELRTPPSCFMNEPFPISIQVRNRKVLFPSFSINVEPMEQNDFHFEPFYLTCIRAGSHGRQTGHAILCRRGRHEMKEIRVQSRYPFGFFSKWHEYDVDGECICYPEILPAAGLNLAAVDILGSSPRIERGVGYDLYTIRDYVPADSARHVHWKASAKTGSLKTREYAAEDSRRFAILLDRYGGPSDAQQFERLVSQAASLAFHWMRDDIEIELVSDEWRSGYGFSETHLQSILAYLALVEMSGTAVPVSSGDESAMMLSLRAS